jgi:hypothetical protein
MKCDPHHPRYSLVNIRPAGTTGAPQLHDASTPQTAPILILIKKSECLYSSLRYVIAEHSRMEAPKLILSPPGSLGPEALSR